MQNTPAAAIIRAYRQTHERILKLADKLSAEQLAWQPGAANHSITFHLWHLARWADHLQAAIPGMTAELGRRLGPGAEVWIVEGLAARWGFDPATLGHSETGMYMSDDLATQLPFPPKDMLLDYVRRALAAADRAVDAIDEAQFEAEEQAQPLTEGLRTAGTTVGAAIITHLCHENRHLGMIECLYGLQVGSGTATV